MQLSINRLPVPVRGNRHFLVSRRPSFDSVPRFVVLLMRVLFVLLIIDPSGDQTLVLSDAIGGAARGIRAAAIMIFIVFLLMSLFSLGCLGRIELLPKVGLGMTALVLGVCATHGLVANVPLASVDEISAVIPVLCLPLLLRFDDEQRKELAEFIATMLVVVATAKLMLGQLIHLKEFGALSYKTLFRCSALLLFPYALFLIRYLSFDRSRWNNILLVLSVLGMLTAQARALFIAAAFVSVTALVRFANLAKRLGIVIIFGLAAMLMTWVSDNQYEHIAGRWTGEIYLVGIDYRIAQAQMLLSRFYEKPIIGHGLGYFTQGYESYEDLGKPFLLELDLPNFATKTGLPLFALYVAAYVLYAVAYRRATFPDRATQQLALGYVLLILGLLLYSLFQTFHSSLLYWFFYAVAFAFIFGRRTRVLPPNPRPSA